MTTFKKTTRASESHESTGVKRTAGIYGIFSGDEQIGVIYQCAGMCPVWTVLMNDRGHRFPPFGKLAEAKAAVIKGEAK